MNYRALDEKTIDDKYPLPNVSDLLDRLGRATYFTVTDLASGLHRIEIDPSDTRKTVLSAENGHYELD